MKVSNSSPEQPKIKIVKKTIIRTDQNSEEEEEEDPDHDANAPIIDGTDMIHQYSVHSETELSKDEMIEQIDYQRDILIKNRSKYTDADYQVKLKKIEELLSNLRRGLVEANLHDTGKVNVSSLIKLFQIRKFLRNNLRVKLI